MDLYNIFRSILRLFPELSRYNIVFETFESEPGFSVGEVRRRGNSFVVKVAINLVEDEAHASFTIAHELAHILVNPHNIPVEGEKWEPRNDVEGLEQSIEDMVCDWIALKRLEQHYRGDREKLKKLYEVYLDSVGPEGYVALAEDMKHKVLKTLREKYLSYVKELLEKYFMNIISLEDLESMNPFIILALSKYVGSNLD
ncbi:MAG: hypothetical protein ACTSVA_03330 [Candidatus Njordarchaeales archaeon]